MVKKSFILALLCLFALPACGGRIPSDAKTANLSKGFFKKYGKKYQETVFYKNPPQEVDVKATQELQRNLANSFVLVKLQDGTEVPVILTLLKKFPMGWRVSSWEWVHQAPSSP